MKLKDWNIKDLIGAEYNPRQLTEKQFADLQDSIKRFGFQEPVIVNTNKDRKGIIISGHQRTRVAESLGIDKVPCVELDLTLEQEKELNIRMNKNTGSFDMDSLANYFDTEDLLNWGFEDWEIGIEDWETPEEPEQEEKQEKKKSLTFKYSEEVYNEIVDRLKEFDENKNEALLIALQMEQDAENEQN